MNENFEKVKNYLLELDFSITSENEEDGIFVVDKEEDAIKNLVLVVADPLLIVEQFIFELNDSNPLVYKNLLQFNRDFIHGAFVLDETGRKVIFRNTHELENLDLNEIEATFNSLAVLLSEHSQELIDFSK